MHISYKYSYTAAPQEGGLLQVRSYTVMGSSRDRDKKTGEYKPPASERPRRAGACYFYTR